MTSFQTSMLAFVTVVLLFTCYHQSISNTTLAQQFKEVRWDKVIPTGLLIGLGITVILSVGWLPLAGLATVSLMTLPAWLK